MNHKIGLVLDGGGGKGAYQIGVWRALIDSGLIAYVTDIAGSSVGGLNAALFAKGDYTLAEHIWTEEISGIKPEEIQIGVSRLIEQYLGDMSFFDNTNMNCFITAHCTDTDYVGDFCERVNGGIRKYSSDKTEYFNMRFLSDTQRSDMLLRSTVRYCVLIATAALPVLTEPMIIDGNGSLLNVTMK